MILIYTHDHQKSITQFWYITTVLVCFKKSNNFLEKYQFFHETWQFFKVFEVLCETGIYLILILIFFKYLELAVLWSWKVSNTRNCQFFGSDFFGGLPKTQNQQLFLKIGFFQIPRTGSYFFNIKNETTAPHSGSGFFKLVSPGNSLVEWLMILICCNGSQIDKLFHLLLPGWWGYETLLDC